MLIAILYVLESVLSELLSNFHSVDNRTQPLSVEMDVAETFKIPFKVLKFFGLWHQKSTSWRYRILSVVFIFLFLHPLTYGEVLYFFHFEDILELTDLISIVLTHIGAGIKTLFFMYRLHDIIKLTESLDNLLQMCKHNENTNIKARVNFGLRAFKMYWFSGITASLLSGVVPIYYRKEHILPFKMYTPFDYKSNDFIFASIAIWQVVINVIGCSIDISIHMQSVIFMCYAAGLLEDLSIRLSQITSTVQSNAVNPTKSVSKKEIQKYYNCELLQCIRIHLKVKEFLSNIQKNFSSIIMMQGLSTSVILCTTVFVLSMVRSKVIF